VLVNEPAVSRARTHPIHGSQVHQAFVERSSDTGIPELQSKVKTSKSRKEQCDRVLNHRPLDTQLWAFQEAHHSSW